MSNDPAQQQLHSASQITITDHSSNNNNRNALKASPNTRPVGNNVDPSRRESGILLSQPGGLKVPGTQSPQRDAKKSPLHRQTVVSSRGLLQKFDITSLVAALDNNTDILESVTRLSLSSQSTLPSSSSSPRSSRSRRGSTLSVINVSNTRGIDNGSNGNLPHRQNENLSNISDVLSPTQEQQATTSGQSTTSTSKNTHPRQIASAHSNGTRSSRLPVPSTLFYGTPSQSPYHWIQYYEEFADSLGWSDQSKIERVMLCLRKKALNWFSEQEVLEKNWSWSKFKQEFIQNAGENESKFPKISHLVHALDQLGLGHNKVESGNDHGGGSQDSSSHEQPQHQKQHQFVFDQLFQLGRIGIELAALLWVPALAPMIDSHAWMEMMLPYLAKDTKIWLKSIKKEYEKRKRLKNKQEANAPPHIISAHNDNSNYYTSANNDSGIHYEDIDNGGSSFQIDNGTNIIVAPAFPEPSSSKNMDNNQEQMVVEDYDFSGVPMVDSLSILDTNKFMAKHLKSYKYHSVASSQITEIPDCEDYHWLISDWTDEQNQYSPYFYIHDEIL
ncbi:hypothetical protein H4219_003226 [Mycoemilia scoparia]|uniref:Retrotransposon gag domain-containing protein n=1 Tax=Mycoemilia scoparia TaxID=417184 RepID=A0A9W7ZW73_9FUNG|nr:hypothetical protein H4219_003226 [Mycoemilia scoparia]